MRRRVRKKNAKVLSRKVRSIIRIGLIILISAGQRAFVLGEQEKQGAGDERVAIEDKIWELERIINQKGSEELKKQAEELKKIEKTIKPETQQQGVEERDSQMNQEAIEMQRKRISEIDQNIDAILLSPEKIREIEKGLSGERIKEIEEGLPPGKKRKLDERLDKEKIKRRYFSCKAVLEHDVNLCNSIEGESGIRECRGRFQGSLFSALLGEITKNQRVTAGALDLCRQVINDTSQEDCKLIANACLTGDASVIAVIPAFEGWRPEAMALVSGNPEYCKGIESAEGMKNCQNNATYASAIKAGSPLICLKIEDDVVLRKICQLYFGQDKNSCEELLNN